jgi:ABC-type nitrate/sulfonate/bicarbonate transport system substrate-binding protein
MTQLVLPNRRAALALGAGALVSLATGRGRASELNELRWALTRNLTSAPIFFGLEQGVFERHGFDVKIQLVDSAQGQIKAVQSSEAELGLAPFGSLAAARSQAIAVKGIGVISGASDIDKPDDEFGLVANGASGVTRVADLVGKRVGVQFGGTMETYFVEMLRAHGLTREQMTVVNVNQINARAALASIDAVVTIEPYVAFCLATVPGTRLVQRGGGYIAQRVMFHARDEWIAADRARAQRVVAAVFEAMQRTRLDQDAAADTAGRWLAGSLAPAILRQAIRAYRYDPRSSPAVRASWDEENRVAVSLGRSRRMVPWEEAFEPSFTETVLRERTDLVADFATR